MKTRSFTGTTNPELQPYETAHRSVARRAAAESIVLLKNEENVLPVSADTPIALYGAGAGHTIKGGTGSGDVNERYSVTITEGLKNAGYRITTEEWLDDYERRFTAARDEWGFKGFIMTDWTTTHDGPECTAAGCMRAGNDMVMPGRPEDQENIRQALYDVTLDIKELKA